VTSSGSTEAGAPASPPAAARVIAVVKDLFFVARIRETARLAGVPLDFARDPAALDGALATDARLVLLDLTGGFDYAAVFGAIEGIEPARRPRVVAFTTHALARETQPWHARCDRVVTKETLTQELGTLLREARP
jgi:hypothetical protein